LGWFSGAFLRHLSLIQPKKKVSAGEHEHATYEIERGKRGIMCGKSDMGGKAKKYPPPEGTSRLPNPGGKKKIPEKETPGTARTRREGKGDCKSGLNHDKFDNPT